MPQYLFLFLMMRNLFKVGLVHVPTPPPPPKKLSKPQIHDPTRKDRVSGNPRTQIGDFMEGVPMRQTK